MVSKRGCCKERQKERKKESKKERKKKMKEKRKILGDREKRKKDEYTFLKIWEKR